MSDAPENPSTMLGKKAPDFRLADQHGATHTLSAYVGRHVVLYFYPKDDTPGCAAQACGFRDSMTALRQLGVVVLGVSILDTGSKLKFAEKHGLDFPLLADAESKVAKRYGVWVEKKMFGLTFMGVSRETFLIGPEGKIAMHWPKAKGSKEHSAEVIAWLQQNI